MKKYILIFILLISNFHFSQGFRIIPLGVHGGIDEANLSSYLISDDDEYFCLDAGTLYSGIKKYLAKNKAEKMSPSMFLKKKVKAYFISHPHFDHTSGLIINAPDDDAKKIYAAPLVIEAFKKHVFSWETWANFANEGEAPTLNKYQYQSLNEREWTNIESTNLQIKMFYLSHTGESKSSAALIRNKTHGYFLYLGDTGADRIEHTRQLNSLWKEIAPLIEQKQLKGIAIECSYTNQQADNQLYGHLKPELLVEELSNLESILEHKESIKGLNIIITHIKPKPKIKETIRRELHVLEEKGMHLIFAKQGETIRL